MEWYHWLLISWPLCGFLALVLNILDHPKHQENIGWAEAWPVVFGPLWLAVKLWQRLTGQVAY